MVHNCTKFYIFAKSTPIFTSMNNISTPKHVITGGTISASYPDNAQIIVSDNAEVTSLPDTWNRGDKIFNVGNETDWDVFIKR